VVNLNRQAHRDAVCVSGCAAAQASRPGLLARVFLFAGERERAIDQLEVLLAVPSYLSPACCAWTPHGRRCADAPDSSGCLPSAGRRGQGWAIAFPAYREGSVSISAGLARARAPTPRARARAVLVIERAPEHVAVLRSAYVA